MLTDGIGRERVHAQPGYSDRVPHGVTLDLSHKQTCEWGTCIASATARTSGLSNALRTSRHN
jgi:hypothetical protein